VPAIVGRLKGVPNRRVPPLRPVAGAEGCRVAKGLSARLWNYSRPSGHKGLRATYLQAILYKTHRAMNITFNELREIKDRLPDGSIHRIAKQLDMNVETVWNYFGGYSHPEGRPMGVHVEGGAQGGVVSLDDTRILDLARQMIEERA
jgi:hypothetical protein